MPRTIKRSLDLDMTKRRWNGCNEKTRLPSKRKAIGMASALVSKDVFPGMSVYHCRVCRGWHLSSQVK